MTPTIVRQPHSQHPNIVLFANTDWYLFNFRRSLYLDLIARGCSVFAICPEGEYGDRLAADGVQRIPLSISRQGQNPFAEIRTLLRVISVYRQVRPDAVHHFTIKPVIYGSLAARVARIAPTINSITGLGHLFIDQTFATRFVRSLAIWLYRLALSKTQVIFENSEDLAAFVRMGAVVESRAHLIKGVGVDTDRFAPVERAREVSTVLFAGRLLFTKGISDFVQAAKILRARGIRAQFRVVGSVDDGNPASVPAAVIEDWSRHVDFAGWQGDMARELRAADIFCLPSYREGLPTAIVEAMASGLPVVATDVPGCRDVVVHMETGLLVAPQNPSDLAGALLKLIENGGLRARFGAKGRARAAGEFASRHVIERTCDVYRRAGLTTALSK